MRFPSLGRVAKPASVRVNAFKTLAQSLTMKGIFLVALPYVVYRVEELLGLARYRFASPMWQMCAVMVFLLGALLAESSAFVMVKRGEGTPLPTDCPAKLVIAGPYRWIRNPMAMGSLGEGFAVGLWLGSPPVLFYVFLGVLTWNFGARPWEERDLAKRFGRPYERYREAVRCWVPRLRPYEP